MDSFDTKGNAPELIDDYEYEGNGIIGSALSDAVSDIIISKEERKKELKKAGNAAQYEERALKRSLGIRPPKQSSFASRGNDALGDVTADRAIWVVLNNERTTIYKDGADIAPRLLMGIPAYGKACVKNAFEHLINFQQKIKSVRGESPENAPKWVIITHDTSMIMDRNIISRLEEARDNVAVLGAYGFQQVRQNGKWYQLGQADLQTVRGCYIQGNMETNEWDFIIGDKFRDAPRYQVLIVHGPFIAIRGEVFYQMNFDYMAKHSRSGFWHYMADISMECNKMGLMSATIKTTVMQFDKLSNHETEDDFIHDQALFTSKWQDFFPSNINTKR